MRPRPTALLLAAIVAVACGGGGEGRGGAPEDDVGAQLACEAIAENYDEILADPEAHPGELGEIIGYAQSADDPELRDAAERFNEGPTSGLTEAFKDIRRRCVELGLI
jgi:hypothetical protein